MNLAFCETKVLFGWTAMRVAERAERKISVGRLSFHDKLKTVLDDFRKESIRIACSASDASAVVTEFYKDKDGPPFTGETKDFPTRKALARLAAEILYDDAIFVSPDADRFRHATELWMAFCEHGEKRAYAGFSDYLNAATILNPPSEHVVTHVVVSHPHLPYILRRARASVRITHL